MFAIEFIVRQRPGCVKDRAPKTVRIGGMYMLKKLSDVLAGLPMTIVAGVFLLLISPLVLSVTDLSLQAEEYLRWMLVMCAVYMVGKYINGTTIAGIFCAGGDSRFGFLCDAVTLWCFTVPAGILAAFVFKWPVLVVYCIVNSDEIVKLPAVYRHYRKYKWLKDLTVREEGRE